MTDRIGLRREREGTVVLSLSRLSAGVSLLVHLGSAVVVAWALVDLTVRQSRPEIATWLLAALALLVFLPGLVIKTWRDLVVWYGGRIFSFDSATGVVLQNGRALVRFDEVEAVQLRRIALTVSGDSDTCEFRLSLVTRDGRKVYLAQSADEPDLADAAEEVAKLIGVDVRRK